MGVIKQRYITARLEGGIATIISVFVYILRADATEKTEIKKTMVLSFGFRSEFFFGQHES